MRRLARAVGRVRGLSATAASGLLLVTAAAVAFAAANSPWSDAYLAVWQTELRVGVGDYGLEKSLILWINDGLMAIFFLLVGLEIKRELIEGALSSRRRAALPLFAAVGGIAVPAVIYALVNARGGDLAGWAVPAATDIAFALGILALLGKRVPVELKIFLTAVAVVDDLGAILIIAVFFTDSIAVLPLAIAGATLAALLLCSRAGVQRNLVYVLGGLALWLAVLVSGLHATIAGVLLAATIPTRGRAADDASPLVRWEHGLQPYVLFAIVPLFALANAGVAVTGAGSGLGAVGWGVALGLFLGKPLGVTGGALVGVRLGACELPRSLSWSQLHAAGWLAGIGFTMSLFVTNLALTGASATAAKLGLLSASLAASAVGIALVLRSSRATSPRQRETITLASTRGT